MLCELLKDDSAAPWQIGGLQKRTTKLFVAPGSAITAHVVNTGTNPQIKVYFFPKGSNPKTGSVSGLQLAYVTVPGDSGDSWIVNTIA